MTNGNNDIVSPEVRSRIMRSVGRRDTRPELIVRRLVRDLGVFYRIENRDLPGSPDIANRSRGWAIFVNGCFWHGHRNCRRTKGGKNRIIPRSNQKFWMEKIEGNRARDERKQRELRRLGFRVLTVWECEIAKPESLPRRLRRFLG